jgi:hypothetical protein
MYDGIELIIRTIKIIIKGIVILTTMKIIIIIIIIIII